MSKILYNDGKWDGLWDLPKYQKIRDKIVNTFNELVFVEDGHKYFLHGKEIMCVSNVTHMFQEHFDAPTKARETFERNYDNPESKYYHMTIEEIEEAWKLNSKQACDIGSERHAFGECCFYFMTRQYDKIFPEFQDRLTKDGGFEAIYPKEEAIVSYYEDLPKCFIPILAETKVYIEKETYSYSGTFDILFYYEATLDGKNDTDSGLIIMDWKSNKDLFKNFKGKKLLKPLDGLLDAPVSLYKAQLSLYHHCLENIGLKIIDRRLIWLRSDGTYNKIRLESYVSSLSNWLAENFLSQKNK